MIAGTARQIVAHRRIVIAGLLVAGALAAAGLPRLRSDFTVDELFADAGDQARIGAAFRATYGNTDNSVVILYQAAARLSAADLKHIAALGAAAGGLEAVAEVTSITTVPIIEESGEIAPSVSADDDLSDDGVRRIISAAVASPLLSGRLISESGTTAIVVLQLDAAIDRADQLERVVSSLESLVAGSSPPPGSATTLGGLPFVRVAVIRAMQRDQVRLLPIGLAVCLLILFLSFRWLPALILPLVVVGLAALLVVGGMAWTGTAIDVVNNIVPLLIVIIGVSDSIHLIARHLEESHSDEARSLEPGARGGAAASRSTAKVAVACLLTSVTTAIGFASLYSSNISILRGFGAVAAIGVMVALLVTVTFLPAALAGFAPPARARALVVGLPLGRLARALVHRRTAIIVASSSALLAGGALWVCSHLTVDEGVRRQFDEGSQIGKTMAVLEEQFQGLRPIELSLSSAVTGRFVDPEVTAALDRLTTWAGAQSISLSAISYATFLREVRLAASGGRTSRDLVLSAEDDIGVYAALIGRLDAFITADHSRTRLSIGLADSGSRAVLEFAARLRERATTEMGRFDDIEIAITGEGYASSLGLESLIRDLGRSLAIAVLGIFFVLSLAFRSVRLGLIGLPPSALPIAFGLAYMTARGIPLGTATVIVFSVALGLAVDGTIHVIARFREELAAGVDREPALIRAIDSSGRAIVATCLTLIVGFGILALSSFVPVRHFGELIAVCIVATLICQLVLLPPLLALFGRT